MRKDFPLLGAVVTGLVLSGSAYGQVTPFIGPDEGALTVVRGLQAGQGARLPRFRVHGPDAGLATRALTSPVTPG